MAQSITLSTKGAVPKATNTLANFLQPPKPTTQSSGLIGPPAPNMSVVQQGTNPGLLPGVNSSSQQKVVKTGVDGSTTTTHAAAPNKNVLAQQQALNKLGAGLIEDGISGPKTSAAVAAQNAGTLPGQKSTVAPAPTPTPKVEQPKADVARSQNTASQTQPVAPDPATTAGRTQGVLNAGQFTPTEQGLIGGSAVEEANKKLTDFREKYYEKIGDIQSQAIPLEFQQGRSGVLSRQAAQTEGALQTGVTNALANQGQQIGLAQTQASRAQGVAGTVFNAGLNQQGSFGAPSFNPLTGEYTSNGQFGGVDASSNIQSIKDFTSKINDIDSQSQAIDNNFSRAINYATSAGLTGVSPILEGFKNRFGTGFLTNPSVVGFNQAVGALNTQLQAFGEQPIDINTATAQTLKQAQETVKKDLLTQKSNLQGTKDKLLNSGTSGGSTGGNMFGSFF